MKRIEINGMSPTQIMERYGVHRGTAYRAVKRGYLCLDYHKRQIVIDPARAEENLDLIQMVVEQTLWRKFGWIRNKADARSEAILGLLELTGHPDFGNKNWMITVVQNRLRDFAKKERNYLRRASSLDAMPNYEALLVVAPEL